MGHRRFLPMEHKWQKQKKQFDGKKENKVAPKRPFGDDYYSFKMLHFYLECVLDSNVGKRKERGKAKGVALSHGLEIITPQVVRQISIIFFQCLSGPWITFTEYPEEEFEILFACFKEAQFTYTCSEDELRDAFYRVVKNGYSKWMFQLRLPVFKKYVSVENRITHCPDNIPPPVWKEMVGKWMKKDKRNKDNNKAVDIPIECFKNFHVRKHSTEVWTHKKAKQLYIYMETIGKPLHGHILGLGVGVKAKDVYGSSSDESSKCAQLVSSMIFNSDTQRPSVTANVSLNEDVEQSIHVDEE
ncbi:hypothetical protein ACOSP7_022631 [Xanthoceras sorbifolium]